MWLKNVHRHGEFESFEVSAKENIGVSIMIEWIVKAAQRIYPVIQKMRTKKANRFQKTKLKEID